MVNLTSKTSETSVTVVPTGQLRELSSFQWSIRLTSILLIAGILTRYMAVRRVLLLCIIAADIYLVFCTTTGNMQDDHQLGNTLASNLLMAIDYLILTDPQRDFWRVGEGKYHDLPRKQRLGWAIDLVNNYRGIGWNWEAVKAHPPHPSDSMGRWRFGLKQLGRWLMAYCMIDIARAVILRREACRTGGSFYQDGLLWLPVYVLAWYLQVCFSAIKPHAVFCAVSVILGFAKPSERVNLYGDIREAHSMRRFWGRAWHDVYRRFLTTNAQYVSRTLLGLQKGDPIRPYVELYLSFFLSGCVHWVGTYMVLRDYVAPTQTIFFFLMQAVVITLEDRLISLGKQMGIKDSWSVRLAGYIWVAAWMIILTPIRTEPLVKAGFFEAGKEGFSVIQSVADGKWRRLMDAQQLKSLAENAWRRLGPVAKWVSLRTATRSEL